MVDTKKYEELFVIGDVHGEYNKLINLLDKIKFSDPKQIIFSGDVIDRGYDSYKVVKLIQNEGFQLVRGNHEDFANKYKGNIYNTNNYGYSNGGMLNTWGQYGGEETLNSYLRDSKSGELIKDCKWFGKLPLYIEFPNMKDFKNRHLVVSHSSVVNFFNKYKKNLQLFQDNSKDEFFKLEYEHFILNSENLMLFNREIPKTIDNDFFNIFGHTPTFHFLFEEFYGDFLPTDLFKFIDEKTKIIIDKDIGYADIDTGACYKYPAEYMNRLTALSFPNFNIYQS